MMLPAVSTEPSEEPKPQSSRLGKFIQTYHTFLSSFVIGVAGLIATSIWQYRQSQVAAEQARSEHAIARTKADNDWRIARAEILSKNLNILSTQGPQTADQRFGVLLSLTRGNIIDPELAVSYALELGRDNADYMRSVLASTSGATLSATRTLPSRRAASRRVTSSRWAPARQNTRPVSAASSQS